jgi:hypothetical protein
MVLSLVEHLGSRSEMQLESRLADYLVAKLVGWTGTMKAERREFLLGKK